MRNTGYLARLAALGRLLTSALRPGSGGVGVQLAASWRMLRATLGGRYRGMDRRTLALLALSAAYVVSPVDLVPESLLAVFGLLDDAAVAMWLAGTLAWETERFRLWETSAQPDGVRVVPGEVVTRAG